MKKIISFSLWGKIRLYCIGAIKNAILAKKFFPGWICRFYYDKSVPEEVINKLKELDNTELVFIEKESGGKIYKDNGTFGSLWRFLVCIDPNVDMFLVCDTDSRLNLYLKKCMGMVNNEKNFIRFVDLPSFYPIAAGGFGGLKNSIKFKKEDFEKYTHGKFYCDQDFLKNEIFPQLGNNLITVPRTKIKNQTLNLIFKDLFITNITGNYVGYVLDEYDKGINKNKTNSFNYQTNYDDLDNIINTYTKTIELYN